MPYAKTSLRAEQRALREKMRELGMSHRQIAVEFARRYRLRPRAAWRNAYGWSLTEAAEQISTYAARAGLDNGATVAMTAAHLCEHENWPGEGQKPTGRRPIPYLLSLLATVYGCAVQDLLDAADYEHMPAADRLILDKTTPSDVRRSAESAATRRLVFHGGSQVLGRPHPLHPVSMRRRCPRACPANWPLRAKPRQASGTRRLSRRGTPSQPWKRCMAPIRLASNSGMTRRLKTRCVAEPSSG